MTRAISPEGLRYWLRQDLLVRIAALEAALRAVCDDVAHVLDVEGEYFGGCDLCHTPCEDDGTIPHAPDCPVAAALALLADA